MASQEPYDPYIPSNSRQTPMQTGNSRTENVQREIDQATEQLKHNIQSASERGERLDVLQDKSANLADGAQGFRRGANRVRKQMWWKDMKMRMCIIIGIILLLVVIIVPSVVASKKN